MLEPLVTVVISPREGHTLTEASLLSVLADDVTAFDLVYLDIASPPKTAMMLQAHAAASNFKLVRHDYWVPPSVARKAALSKINTKYVAFADNDIMVERGCLDKLLACAEETGAGLVCPLYAESGGGRQPRIHMAGGVFHWAEPPARGLVDASHRFQFEPLERANALTREKVDFAEYHYMLGRRDLLSHPSAISDDVLLVHEHLDLALFAQEQGMDVFLEPAARVTYAASEPRALADIDFFRRRWDVESCHRSLAAFVAKWPTPDPDALIARKRSYAASRLVEVELRRLGSAAHDLDAPMRPSELAHSRYAFREQALSRGYPQAEVRWLETACDLATLLFDGLYRPDGRPFLNHAIGTASALVRYDLQAPVVQAGLLHAAFSHRPAWISEEELLGMLRDVPEVVALVRAQPAARAFLARDDADLGALNMNGARVAAILAANEIDMRLAGEYHSTGRPTELSPATLGRIGELLRLFDVGGLARQAPEPARLGLACPILGGVRHESFRLDAKDRRTVRA
jgi:GT2 family glycosyltransferase